jgi:hypothetical protein
MFFSKSVSLFSMFWSIFSTFSSIEFDPLFDLTPLAHLQHIIVY